MIVEMVQGLTELFTRSNSDQVIFQPLSAISEPQFNFYLVHMGTLVAVFIAFWPETMGFNAVPLHVLVI